MLRSDPEALPLHMREDVDCVLATSPTGYAVAHAHLTIQLGGGPSLDAAALRHAIVWIAHAEPVRAFELTVEAVLADGASPAPDSTDDALDLLARLLPLVNHRLLQSCGGTCSIAAACRGLVRDEATAARLPRPRRRVRPRRARAAHRARRRRRPHRSSRALRPPRPPRGRGAAREQSLPALSGPSLAHGLAVDLRAGAPLAAAAAALAAPAARDALLADAGVAAALVERASHDLLGLDEGARHGLLAHLGEARAALPAPPLRNLWLLAHGAWPGGAVPPPPSLLAAAVLVATHVAPADLAVHVPSLVEAVARGADAPAPSALAAAWAAAADGALERALRALRRRPAALVGSLALHGEPPHLFVHLLPQLLGPGARAADSGAAWARAVREAVREADLPRTVGCARLLGELAERHGVPEAARPADAAALAEGGGEGGGGGGGDDGGDEGVAATRAALRGAVATCAVTLEPMHCPVALSDGRTYELATALALWRGGGPGRSPITREAVLPWMVYNRQAVEVEAQLVPLLDAARAAARAAAAPPAPPCRRRPRAGAAPAPAADRAAGA